MVKSEMVRKLLFTVVLLSLLLPLGALACPDDFSLAMDGHMVRLQISPANITPVTIVPIWDLQLNEWLSSMGYIDEVPEFPPPFHAILTNTSEEGYTDVALYGVVEYRITFERFNKSYLLYPYEGTTYVFFVDNPSSGYSGEVPVDLVAGNFK